MKLKFLFTLMCILALHSCQDAPAPGVQDASPDDAAPIEDACSDQVSYRDINKAIAAITSSGDFGMERSRASMYSVDSLISKDGVLTALVVNFANDGGFILLSPQKTFYPVMAYSDKGHFDVNVEGKPVEEWTEDMSDVISQLDYLPSDSIEIYRRMWNDLLFESSINKKPVIRKSPPIDEVEIPEEEMQKLYRAVRAKRTELESQGYKTYLISEYLSKDDITAYENIRQLVQGAIYPLYESVWEELTLVVDIDNMTTTTKENMLKTFWGQDGMFNISFPTLSDGTKALAGCGPVAIGQVMYYHKYPANKPWSSMVTSFGNKATSDFLYELAIKSKADFKPGGTSVDKRDLQSTLESYGYICSRDIYSVSTTLEDVFNNRPVVLGGVEKGKEKGHIWVASGASISNWEYYTIYYTMTSQYGMSSFYQTDRKYLRQNSIYMNWGWDGRYDGFYVENGTLKIPGTTNKTVDRIMINVQKP